MAFDRTEEWLKYRIKLIQTAINGTRKALENFTKEGTTQTVIDAHKAQIESYTKTLTAIKRELKIKFK